MERIGLYLTDDAAKELQLGYLVIPKKDVGHPKDLRSDIGTSLEFGIIKRCGFIVDTTEIPKTFEIGEESSKHVFSKEFYNYMRIHADQIVCPPPGMRTKNVYCIPLHAWDHKFPIFETMEINDDMAAYVKKTENFFKANVADYSSIADAIQGFTDFLYRKTETNFFFVELMFKAFLSHATKDPNTKMEKLSERVGKHLGTRMGYGYINSYLSDPAAALLPSDPIDLDYLFGWPTDI
jgi:hypothetical protein